MRGQIHDWTQRDPTLEVILEENARLRAQVAALSRSVPSEIPLQLDLNLALLDDADAMYDSLPAAARARIESSQRGQQRGLVIGLAFLPAESRNRIRRCITRLRQMVSDWAPAQPPAVQRSPCPLRLLPPVQREMASLTAGRR